LAQACGSHNSFHEQVNGVSAVLKVEKDPLTFMS